MNRRNALKLCLSTSFAGIGFASISPIFAQESNGGFIHRQLRWNVLLANPLSEELKDQIFWMYLPMADTSTQHVSDVAVTADYRLLHDSYGHSVMELKIARLAPFGQRAIRVTVTVSLRTQPITTSLPEDSKWLSHERYIEVNEPRIQSLAAELKHHSPFKTARAVYEWVAKNIRYAGYVSYDLGAVEALTQRQGDCTEYAYLVVALLRANGIPARMIGGYVVDRNILVRAEEYHNWAEFYADGCWQLLDAQKQNWLSPSEQYVTLRNYLAEVTTPIGLAHRFAIEGKMIVRL
jgi:hypothetical protein